MPFLLAITTFFIVALVIFAVVLVTGGGGARQEIVQRRLAAVEKAQRRGAESLGLGLVRDDLYSEVPQLQRLFMRWSWPARLREYVRQAGLTIRPANLFVWSGVLALAGYVVLWRLVVWRLNPALWVLAPVVCVGFALFPFAYVAFKRHRRLKAFEREFPEAIDLLCRAVRAGHAFTTGLEMISTELPEPVAGEFRVTFEEQNFGLPLKDALLNLTERVPLIDVRFFVTALLIQKESGGNLAEILENLARVIRERFKILGDVRTKSAQGRLTALILISLPPTVGLMMFMLNPSYMGMLFTDDWGHYMLLGAGIMQLVGSLLLWKIVTIEV